MDKSPANIGSRECNACKLPKNMVRRCSRLQNRKDWSRQQEIIPTKESEEEAKLLEEVFYATKVQENQSSGR